MLTGKTKILTRLVLFSLLLLVNSCEAFEGFVLSSKVTCFPIMQDVRDDPLDVSFPRGAFRGRLSLPRVSTNSLNVIANETAKL